MFRRMPVVKKAAAPSKGPSYASLVCFTVINLTVLVVTSYLWYVNRKALSATPPSGDPIYSKKQAEPLEPQTVVSIPASLQPLPSSTGTTTGTGTASASSWATSALTAATKSFTSNSPASKETLASLVCADPVWCNIPIPAVSHYKFDTPITDSVRWKKAQIAAASGEQVLLERIVKVFPNSFDFLDGDRSFRRLHSLMDIFVDQKTGLNDLLKPSDRPDKDKGKNKAAKAPPKGKPRRRLAAASSSSSSSSASSSAAASTVEEVTDDEKEPAEPEPVVASASTSSVPPGTLGKGSPQIQIAGHVDGKRVVPDAYNYRQARRAPILQMGYFGFNKNQNTFFAGDFIGGNFIKKQDFFFEWNKVKHLIDVPFITVCALNENWGLLSTMFPNRTAAWGQCCDQSKDRLLYEFLDHPKTLMLITNQHHNMSHPKLLTIPRGIPLTWQYTAKLMWDSQRFALSTNIKKSQLLFAASSNWGARGQMIKCISSKFTPAEFEGHSNNNKKSDKKASALIKLDRRHYYEKLSGTIFGLALPGLGYDCFRTWELLTMGTIVVLERGVGLDRTLWRLPALLLEDFNDVTPQLLRSAYVEAIYRADEFEYHRLTQSYWFSVITNVSASMSLRPLLDQFPMRAEEPSFARPRVPYPCGQTNPHTCGKGTKRTPRQSC